MKNSLAVKGLSLSQAQSISNMCYQRAMEITNTLNGINNATRIVTVGGKDYDKVVGKRIPANVADLIIEKAKLHATQGFLMTNIKAKDQLLTDLKKLPFISAIDVPVKPDFIQPKMRSAVDEAWGWDQLSMVEMCEFIEQEAYAAHIGQFIHKDSPLDMLRRELPLIKTLEWMEVEIGKKTPIKVTPHHTSAELLAHHETLATMHRTHEMRVNYFKAKVKNLVTEENASIAKENGIEQAKVNAENNILHEQWNGITKAYQDAVSQERQEFESKRQEDIKETAALRIDVDPRFQALVDEFLAKLVPAEPKA